MRSFLQSLAMDVRAMPRGLWVLVGGQFINRFGSFVNPFLALYLQREGFTLGEVAVILGAIATGGFFAPAASGYLTDAIGRRNTIVVSLVGGAVSILGLYGCSTLPQLVAVAVVHGFFAFLFGPAANALLTDLVTPSQRVTAYALLRLAINGGFAAGPAVAGFLYDHAPVLIFVGDAATTLIFATLAWFFLPHGLRTIAGRVSSPGLFWRSWVEAATDALRNGPFVQLLAGMLFMAMAFVQIFNVLAVHATARGLDPVHYGFLMGLNGFIILVVELPLAHWIKRFPPRPMLMVGFAVVGAGCATFTFAESFGAFLAAMTLFTAGEMLSLPPSSGYGAGLAPLAYRGRYSAFQAQVWSSAAIVGSAGVWIYGRIGASWWLVTGCLGLLAAATMTLRVRDRRLAPVAAAPAAIN